MRNVYRRLVFVLLLAFGVSVGGPDLFAGQKTVHVKEYKRKDGTVVKAHDRTAPKSNGAEASPAAAHPAVSHASTAGARSDTCENCDRDEHGKIVRSGKAKTAFKRATGCAHGGPGYVKHIRPLACGGAAAPSNMQSQTTAAAKAKDKTERARC
jgi:hypothetical protein